MAAARPRRTQIVPRLGGAVAQRICYQRVSRAERSSGWHETISLSLCFNCFLFLRPFAENNDFKTGACWPTLTKRTVRCHKPLRLILNLLP